MGIMMKDLTLLRGADLTLLRGADSFTEESSPSQEMPRIYASRMFTTVLD